MGESQYTGPYVLSCKLDGVSGLFSGGSYTQDENGLIGQDVSHLIPYLKLPNNSDVLQSD